MILDKIAVVPLAFDDVFVCVVVLLFADLSLPRYTPPINAPNCGNILLNALLPLPKIKSFKDLCVFSCCSSSCCFLVFCFVFLTLFCLSTTIGLSVSSIFDFSSVFFIKSSTASSPIFSFIALTIAGLARISSAEIAFLLVFGKGCFPLLSNKAFSICSFTESLIPLYSGLLTTSANFGATGFFAIFFTLMIYN